MITPAQQGIEAARADARGVLNENDANLLASALRCAAEKYSSVASSIEGDKMAWKGLVEQFERQSADAIRLAELIEDAQYVQIVR